jgi:NAD+ kinase
MKLALFGRSITDPMIPYFQAFIEYLEGHGVRFQLYQPFFRDVETRISFEAQPLVFSSLTEVEGKVDFLFSFGGDGTILDAVRMLGHTKLPIVGINMGKLGFLSTISKEGVIPALDDLLKGQYDLEERTLLHLSKPKGLFDDFPFALNDLTIYKSDQQSMLTIKTYIDDAFLNAYWADGLIVATPTGSTAYSLSCTGPILTPNTSGFVITPIASHNLTVRPIVIPDDSRIRIEIGNHDQDCFVSLDSRKTAVSGGTSLMIDKAAFTIQLVRLRERHFFKTIREKLNWGRDARN